MLKLILKCPKNNNIMAKSRQELKTRFKAGSKPLESDFVNLIEAFYHKDEDEVGLDGIIVNTDTISTDRSLLVREELTILSSGEVATGSLSLDSSGNLLIRNLESKGIFLQVEEGTGFSSALSIFSNGNTFVPKDMTVGGNLRLNRTGTSSAELIFSRASSGPVSQVGELTTLAQIQAERVLSGDNQIGVLTLTCRLEKPIVASDGSGGGQSNKTQNVLKLESLPNKTNGKVTVLGDFQILGQPLTTSDIRIKKNIQNFTDGLEVVKQLRPVSFQYNGKGNTPDDGITRFGFIAQEVKPVCPQMLHPFEAKLENEDEKETELLNLDTSSLQFILLNAIVELNNKVESLKNQLSKKSNNTKDKITV
jgi:Chaperone of endosialidase